MSQAIPQVARPRFNAKSSFIVDPVGKLCESAESSYVYRPLPSLAPRLLGRRYPLEWRGTDQARLHEATPCVVNAVWLSDIAS